MLQTEGVVAFKSEGTQVESRQASGKGDALTAIQAAEAAGYPGATCSSTLEALARLPFRDPGYGWIQ